ncbi:hypothetical protein QFZ27_001470 [Inquilinus ginsengisoli]|uniref:cytochrome c biogenesis protein CcdA n=1 Tax=Inquilinus ginsengisoli TaxID=363840 RepID=UPI003D19C5E4
MLGAILTVSASTSTAANGVALLGLYSLGLGVPFLLSALFADKALARLRSARRAGRQLQRAAGVVMVAMGVFMITGEMTEISAWLAEDEARSADAPASDGDDPLASNDGNDRDPGTVRRRRLKALLEADVVVHVHVHEALQLALAVQDAGRDASVFGLQIADDLREGPALGGDLGLTARVRTKNGGDANVDAHRSLLGSL